MPKNLKPIEITSFDEIFSTGVSFDGTSERVVALPLEELHDFKDHPFQVRMDDTMLDHIESVKSCGVLVPGIARPRKEGGYELVAGHRRKFACHEASLDTMPIIIREMDDDTATILMVHTNKQRENILPSERAYSLKMLMDALNRQGKRGEPASRQVGESFRDSWSVSIAAEKTGVKERQIHRHIRLTFLTPDLLQMVDDRKLAFNVAVEVSYLREDEQLALQSWMGEHKKKPSLKQAIVLKEKSKAGDLDAKAFSKIMLAEPTLPKNFELPMKKLISHFPPGTSMQTMQEEILLLLAQRKAV